MKLSHAASRLRTAIAELRRAIGVGSGDLLGIVVIWLKPNKTPKQAPQSPERNKTTARRCGNASDSWTKRLGMALWGQPEASLYISTSELPNRAPSILRRVRRLRRIGYQVQVKLLPQPCNNVEDILWAMCHEATPKHSSCQKPTAINAEAKHTASIPSLL